MKDISVYQNKIVLKKSESIIYYEKIKYTYMILVKYKDQYIFRGNLDDFDKYINDEIDKFCNDYITSRLLEYSEISDKLREKIYQEYKIISKYEKHRDDFTKSILEDDETKRDNYDVLENLIKYLK